jgi:hypothetical protein
MVNRNLPNVRSNLYYDAGLAGESNCFILNLSATAGPHSYPSEVEMTDQELLEATYAAFNRRDIELVLSFMHPEVDWPNGMEGGRVHGHAGVRSYWRRQWSMIDPCVEPLRFETNADGRIVVHVRQTVRDLAGSLLSQKMVRHSYVIKNALIQSMEIQDE